MHPDDEDAFRLLVERHSRSVYRMASRMTGRVENAKEVRRDIVSALSAHDRVSADYLVEMIK